MHMLTDTPLTASPRGGRPKGSLNRRTIEGQEFARSIVNDPEYRAMTRKRALAGELPPAVEVELLRHAFGKPPEYFHVTASRGDDDLSALSNDELAAFTEQLALAIRVMDAEDAQVEAEIATFEAQVVRAELEAVNAAKSRA